jgi:hypothetical protein
MKGKKRGACAVNHLMLAAYSRRKYMDNLTRRDMLATAAVAGGMLSDASPRSLGRPTA